MKLKHVTYIDKSDVESTIRSSGGRIVEVVFTKRTNKQLRHMNCRLGVKSYLVSGKTTFNPKDYNLLPVFDLDLARSLPKDKRNKAYRSIPLDAVHSIKSNGVLHIVK